ncbi:hypothetical protein FGG08_006002 [Glutinoglossum americanum]|uniref:MICOS complex subunit MIC60 n=1 Tax=Glutinoglossum americanum TaxID=1670608 RepID=A0A9P8L0V2_9PEZI|nr:hypothetical protein FGG08_006002 [Glutinoglossum americanum]
MLRRYSVDLKKPPLNTKESITKSDPAALPISETNTGTRPPSPLAGSRPSTPDSPTTISPENAPRTPPPPPSSAVQATPPTSSSKDSSPTPPINPPAGSSNSQPPPPLPKPKRKPRRFRQFLVTLALLTCLGYAGGVYYSLVSDNFHDFFTEYVPFGEDAVLYFEEREFRRRFPSATSRIIGASREAANKVTIPSRSGVTWKVAEDTNQQQKGRHVSALKDGSERSHDPGTQAGELKDLESSAIKSGSQKVNVKPEASPAANPSGGEKVAKDPVEEQPTTKDVKSDQMVKPAAVKTIDPLEIRDSEEQTVLDLVTVINNIITIVNSDNAGAKYSSAIESAKAELTKIGGKITVMKDAEKEAAERKIKGLHEEFDKAAKELVRRLEEEMRDQEAHWRDEFESERENLSKSYQDKLQTELKRSNEVAEKRLHNELLEQAIEMKQKFIEDVRDSVEQERNGRLGKLSELSTSVSELEKLTAGWNEVVDANLKTQHLHVAVEAVRSSLEKADRPRPFVRELAALKEIADGDPVVNAAIASINPVAYQQGIATSAQLVDRFRLVADEVRKASLLPEDAGIVSHATSLLLSKFLFKKKGLAVGDDVESILTRTETLLEEGDLDGAAREMNGLTGWAKTLSRDWLAEVRRVLEVQQALDVRFPPVELEFEITTIPFRLLRRKLGYRVCG